MNVIAARSPFQVVIDETDQVATKVELLVWNKGMAIPSVPTYVMSEKIASITQRETNYNISPFILESIKQIENNYIAEVVALEDNSNWCFARIKTYSSLDGVTFDLLADKIYVCVNGYTLVEQGVNYNYANPDNYLLLANKDIVVQYGNPIYYYNFLCTRNESLAYKVEYYRKGLLVYTETFLTSGTQDYYNYKIPIATEGSTEVRIILGTTMIASFFTEQIFECKYEPVVVSFVNRYGGWQPLMFFKASQNSIETKGTEYNLMPESWNYNYLEGQTRVMNLNGTKTIKCNTGWVDENYDELITDLLMSDTILVNFQPAVVKSKSATLKTHLRDKNINYTIDFEYSNNLLNNIV
jgi:hypothetical protein